MSLRLPCRAILLGVALLLGTALAAAAESVLRPEHLAVVVNTADPSSLEAGKHYLHARRVPARNLVQVSIPADVSSLTAEQFTELRQQLEAKLRPDIEAIVMVWTRPYAVACNSITAAVTLGPDYELCNNGCGVGKQSPYFDAAARRPFRELGLRPSMLLPSSDIELAKALIDRGRLSGFRVPEAGAYFIVTSDKVRNSRAHLYPPSGRIAGRNLSVWNLRGDRQGYLQDVMIYEIGAAEVKGIETLRFLPGALADHLTSSGGILVDSPQMSSLRWLEAGATASYGTVSEPCNHPQKFPNPSLLLKYYLSGQTALEAYWKSVAWPAQGVFIGEPLAAPYCASCTRRQEAAPPS